MSYRQIEKLLRCPFNRSHSIQPHRMAKHIIACQKNYPDQIYVKCCFNASHVVKSKDINAHIEECPNRADADKDIYLTMNDAESAASNVRTIPHAIITPAPPCDEDWDSEFVESSYNPALNAIYLPVPRKVPVGFGKSAREKWRLKDVERVRLLKEGLPIEELMADELEALGVLEKLPAEPEQDLAGPLLLDEDEVLLLGGASGGKAFGDEPSSRSRNSGVLVEESARLAARSENSANKVFQDEEVAKLPEKRKVNTPGNGNDAGQDKRKRKRKSKKKQGRQTDWHIVGQKDSSKDKKEKEIEGVTELMKDLHFNKQSS